MKKKISCIVALLASALLLITSCSNAFQVDVTDSNQKKDDGLSVLNVSIGKFGARTIYPEEWTSGRKNNLIYHLTGKPTDTGYSPAISDMESKGRFFTYSEIYDNSAKVQLDPTKWDLTLTAYTATKEQIKQVRDALDAGTLLTLSEISGLETNKALECILAGSPGTAVDLSSGDGFAEFNLVTPLVPGTTALGTAKVDINFINLDNIAKAVIDIKKADTSVTAGGSNCNKTILKNAFVKIGADNLCSINYEQDQIPAGTYTFIIDLLDKNGVVILRNVQDIIIDGGNISKGFVDLTGNEAYGTMPAKPSDLKYKLYFKPEQTPVVIDDVNKIYAQDLTAVDSGVESNYNIDISWTDNADNEYGYKVVLTLKSGDAIEFTYGEDDNTKVTANAAAGSANVSVTAGNLAPVVKGTEKIITVKAPLTTAFTKIEVLAINNYVKLPDDEASVSASVNAASSDVPIGMFAVYYNLQDSGNGVTPSNSVITYEKTPKTSLNKYFVMGYPYGTTTKDLVKGSGKYPYVSLTGYQFGSWQKANGLSPATPAFINVEDADLKADPLLTTGHIELRAAWLTTASLKVSFPNYSVYKTLKATMDNSENGNVIKPDKDGKIILKLPVEKVTSPVFKIYRDADSALSNKGLVYDGTSGADDVPNGITLGKTTVEKDTLTWVIGTFTGNKNPGGVYRVEIKYTYDGKTDYTGNLYVDLNF